MPIGIENRRLDFNGRPENFNVKHVFKEKENRVLIGPFAQSHPERNFINELNDYDADKLEINRDRLSPHEYAEISSSFRFIACPRGNGIDTHRLWENLYSNRIPITIKTGNYKIYELYEKLPIVILDRPQDLLDYGLIDSKYQEVINKTYNMDLLKIDYWKNKILSNKSSYSS